MYPVKIDSLVVQLSGRKITGVSIWEHQLEFEMEGARITLYGDVRDNFINTPSEDRLDLDAVTILVGDVILRVELHDDYHFSLVFGSRQLTLSVDSEQFECVEVEIGEVSEVY